MSSVSLTPSNVREGTAIRRAGKITAQKILAAAREVLIRDGYAQFSMRNVAEAAGLHLANLQYYFPKRSDLVRGLLAYTGSLYEEAYEQLLESASPDPIERLKIILRYQIGDIFVADTQKYFVQLWALLSALEEYPGELLSVLYEFDIGPIRKVIHQIDPTLSKSEATLRAKLLAGIIEGLMIVRGSKRLDTVEGKALFDSTYQIAFGIATGSTPWLVEHQP